MSSERIEEPTESGGEGYSPAVAQLVADYMAAWNAHDVERTLSLFAPDGSYAEFGGGSVMFGREEIGRHLAAVCCAIPDLCIALTAAPDFGSDCILLKWTVEGTHKGEFAGVPGTGKPFKMQGSSALYLRGEQILRALDCFDVGQLGNGTQRRGGGLRRISPGADPNGSPCDPGGPEDNVCWGE